MIRPTVALMTLLALGLSGQRLRAPLELSPRPLPASVLLRVENSLRGAGIACQTDADGTGLLVRPADLASARRVAVLDQYQAELGPPQLIEELEKLPRVEAASVRILGDEAHLMLNAPGAVPVQGAITTVVALFPNISRSNVKVLDAQGRDLTRPRTRARPRQTYYLSALDYHSARIEELLGRSWQAELDRQFGTYQVSLRLKASLEPANLHLLYGYPGPLALRDGVRRLNAEVAFSGQVDRRNVADVLQKLASRSKLEKRLKLTESRWTASQRPLTRLEMERLKAALLPSRPPEENRWLGLCLLWPALTLLGIATARLWQRHSLGRRPASTRAD